MGQVICLITTQHIYAFVHALLFIGCLSFTYLCCSVLFAVDQIVATGDEVGLERSALFLWQGRHSRHCGQELPPALANICGAQVLVAQGEEPPCFLQLFQGGLVLHRGRREDTANNTGVCVVVCVYVYIYICVCASYSVRECLSFVFGSHAIMCVKWWLLVAMCVFTLIYLADIYNLFHQYVCSLGIKPMI